MPMDFPDFDSLKLRAEQRGFRQPHDDETEEQFRSEFSKWMRNLDKVEAFEIQFGIGWDKSDPNAFLKFLQN